MYNEKKLPIKCEEKFCMKCRLIIKNEGFDVEEWYNDFTGLTILILRCPVCGNALELELK